MRMRTSCLHRGEPARQEPLCGLRQVSRPAVTGRDCPVTTSGGTHSGGRQSILLEWSFHVRRRAAMMPEPGKGEGGIFTGGCCLAASMPPSQRKGETG